MISEIREDLYISDLASVDNESLEEHNINRVITMCKDDVGDQINCSHEQYGINDHRHDYSVFEAAVDAIQQAWKNNETVLVHCHAGQSRSPSVSAVALSMDEEITIEQAYGKIKAKREIHPSPHLKIVPTNTSHGILINNHLNISCNNVLVNNETPHMQSSPFMSTLELQKDNKTFNTLNRISLSILRNGEEAVPERANIIGQGTGRVAITLPELPNNKVVKISKPPYESGNPLVRGVVQNAVEIYLTKHSHKLSNTILPTSEWPQNHTRWIIAPKVEKVGIEDKDFGAAMNQIIELGFVSSEYTIKENWGRWNGEIYLIDYGYIKPDEHPNIESILESSKVWTRNRDLHEQWKDEKNN